MAASMWPTMPLTMSLPSAPSVRWTKGRARASPITASVDRTQRFHRGGSCSLPVSARSKRKLASTKPLESVPAIAVSRRARR